ncbi:hypothetical protein CPB83DRAFT_919037, partial [Crepidotus variabilis]
ADAELVGLQIGIINALPRCRKLLAVFSDAESQMKQIVNPPKRSGQQVAIKASKAIRRWLSTDPDRQIRFYHIRSALNWGVQHEAHKLAKSVLRDAAGPFSHTTYDYLRKLTAKRAIDRWVTLFNANHDHTNQNYKGTHWLKLSDPKRRGNAGHDHMVPTYFKGGSWLPRVEGLDTQLTARLCRTITNHAPIGHYNLRFGKPERGVACPCGTADIQTRRHIFHDCPRMIDREDALRVPSHDLDDLLSFLKSNPLAFAFEPEEPP